MLWEQVIRDNKPVSFAIMESGNNGDCSTITKSLIDGLGGCDFKIGVSTDPFHRFTNQAYGYVKEGAARMVVLHRAKSREQAGELERLLISHAAISHNCRNKAPGGEGLFRTHGGSFFTYLVLWPNANVHVVR